MNADTVAIALDRLKFYAKDALNVVSQVGRTKGGIEVVKADSSC